MITDLIKTSTCVTRTIGQARRSHTLSRRDVRRALDLPEPASDAGDLRLRLRPDLPGALATTAGGSAILVDAVFGVDCLQSLRGFRFTFAHGGAGVSQLRQEDHLSSGAYFRLVPVGSGLIHAVFNLLILAAALAWVGHLSFGILLFPVADASGPAACGRTVVVSRRLGRIYQGYESDCAAVRADDVVSFPCLLPSFRRAIISTAAVRATIRWGR